MTQEPWPGARGAPQAGEAFGLTADLSDMMRTQLPQRPAARHAVESCIVPDRRDRGIGVVFTLRGEPISRRRSATGHEGSCAAMGTAPHAEVLLRLAADPVPESGKSWTTARRDELT